MRKWNNDDLFYVCSMIEFVARETHNKVKDIVGMMEDEDILHQLKVAGVNHCLSYEQICDEWIAEFQIVEGNFDITNVDSELATIILTSLDMGEVYQRLIADTLSTKEDFTEGILRVYNDEICDVIDNYNCSAFYEPSYVIARAYQNGGF